MPGPKVACPHCKAVLQMPHALPAGQRVKCSSCGIHFAVGGEPPIPKAAPAVPAGPQALAPAPAFPSAGLAASQGINRKALLYILAGGLLFLGGGTALILLCFSGKGPTENKEVVNGTGEPTDEGNDPDKKKVRKIDTHKPPPPPPPELANYLTKDQKGQVAQAVKLGVADLRSVQNADGTWTDAQPNYPNGVTALVGLTLLECGAKTNDPAIQKVAAFLRQREDSAAKIVLTYEIALTILFLDRLNDPQDKKRITTLALRLVAGQMPSGGWTYTCPILSDGDSQILATLLEKNKGQLTANTATSKLELKVVEANKLRLDDNKPVPAQLTALTVWHGEAVFGQDGADNSNTQFAILAIWAAKTRNLPVQRTLALIVLRFHKGQFADGSWAYQLGAPPPAGVPTMTCAGLLGLAVGQGLINEARGQGSAARKTAAQQDPAIQRGLDYLSKQLGDPHSPWQNASGAPQGNLYLLWSVERVGVIYNQAKIGGKDWYGWGSEQLIANQTIAGDKGFWANGGGYPGQHPTVNTCFALLFLQRANLAKDLTSKLALGD